MTKNLNTKIGAGGAIASTSNIALVHTVMDALLGRAHGLPGIGTFYGKSGLGKSVGAAYASHPAGHNGNREIIRRYDAGEPFDSIRRSYKISRSYLFRLLKRPI